MVREEPESPGEMIRRYRELRDWKQAALARRLDIAPSYVSLIESGKRPLPHHLALKVATTLSFSLEDRRALLQALDMDDELYESYSEQLERGWLDALLDVVRHHPLIMSLQRKPRTLADWVAARAYIGRFAPGVAIPRLERVLDRHDKGFDPLADELLAIVLNDAADACGMAGRNDDALHYARRSEDVCRRIHAGNASSRSARVGIARALVRQQQVAYQRGDEAACWALHEQAMPVAAEVDDWYGLYQSLFFLAYFRFWQARLVEAESLIRRACECAQRIKIELDVWWGIRDGFFLATHWCQSPALSLLLDVLIGNGQSGTGEFNRHYLDYLAVRRNLMWARDFPPLVVRYGWATSVIAAGSAEAGATLRRWVTTSESLGCQHLNVEMRINYGDFLRWHEGKEEEARDMHAVAYEQAERQGYELFKVALDLRRRHPSSSYVGFISSISQRRG